MDSTTILYKTRTPEIFTNLLRLLSLIGIVYFTINLSYNPIVFTVFILLLSIYFLLSETKKIIVKDKQFEILYTRFLFFFNKKKSFAYSDIESINYKTGLLLKTILFFPFLDLLFAIDIEINLKNGTTINIDLEGLNWKEVKKCIKLIEEQIEKHRAPRSS